MQFKRTLTRKKRRFLSELRCGMAAVSRPKILFCVTVSLIPTLAAAAVLPVRCFLSGAGLSPLLFLYLLLWIGVCALLGIGAAAVWSSPYRLQCLCPYLLPGMALCLFLPATHLILLLSLSGTAAANLCTLFLGALLLWLYPKARRICHPSGLCVLLSFFLSLLLLFLRGGLPLSL